MRRFLPGIGPRRLAALVLAAAMSLPSLAYFGRFLLKPYTGLIVNFPEAVSEEGRILFAPRSPLSPAVRAGLLPYRDQILRVGERVIHNLRDLVEVDYAWRTYRPAAIDAIRDGSLRATVILSPDAPLRRVESAFTAAFLIALIGLGFALLLDRGLSLGTLMLSAACFCYALFVAVKPFFYENLLANGLIHLGRVAPWLLLGFGLYYPRPRGRAAARIVTLATVGAAYAAFAAGRLVLFARWAQSGAEPLLARYRDLGRLANIAEAAAYVAFVALLATVLRHAGARERARLQWMLAGFLVALPPYFFLDQLPMILGERGAPRIGTGGFASLFLLPLPVLFTVGFVTSRSLATRRLLTRFLIYALVAVAVLAFFAWLYDPLVGQLSEQYAMSVRAASLVAVFFLAAFLFPAQALLLLVATVLFDRPARRMRELERSNAAMRLALGDPSGRTDWETARQQELVRLLRHVERQAEEIGRRAEAAAGALGAPARGGDELRTAIADVRAARSLAVRLAEAIRPLAAMSGGLPEPCEASRLVAIAVSRAGQRLPGLRVDDRTPPARVRAVPQYVVAALVEIIANAYESEPAGLVTITGKRESGRLRIEESGDGPGFAPEMAAVATDPFTTSKPGHTGVGLYIARRGLALSGGDIGVAGGKGGVVWLEIPLG